MQQLVKVQDYYFIINKGQVQQNFDQILTFKQLYQQNQNDALQYLLHLQDQPQIFVESLQQVLKYHNIQINPSELYYYLNSLPENNQKLRFLKSFLLQERQKQFVTKILDQQNEIKSLWKLNEFIEIYFSGENDDKENKSIQQIYNQLQSQFAFILGSFLIKNKTNAMCLLNNKGVIKTSEESEQLIAKLYQCPTNIDYECIKNRINLFQQSSRDQTLNNEKSDSIIQIQVDRVKKSQECQTDISMVNTLPFVMLNPPRIRIIEEDESTPHFGQVSDQYEPSELILNGQQNDCNNSLELGEVVFEQNNENDNNNEQSQQIYFQ